MGGWHLPSNVVRDDDDSASLFQRSPLPAAGSSPSPLHVHGVEAKKRAPSATRRRIVVRSICSPIAAIFRMTCVRAVGSSANDQLPSSEKTCEVERGGDQARRRPSLEELLRREAAAAACEVSSGKVEESAVVVLGFAAGDSVMSCTKDEEEEEEEEEEEARLAAVSKNRHAVSGQQKQTAVVVPVELDLQRPVAALDVDDDDDDGRAGLSRTVQARFERVVLVLASLRAGSRAPRIGAGPSKGRLYWKLAAGGSRAGGGKAELFYHRPISMGRRCRVQHLEESPYM
ncbi:hypothetical protein ACP4OV_010691 [Aristida adscensionis]